MCDKIKKCIKKIPLHIGILLGIILLGIFFRTYNFHDWLQFQGDQFRDSLLVSHAVLEGPGSLPLLGPRAGGTTLHLGPIFYYFQYVSGSIFHSTDPAAFAYPDLIFSILAIPLSFLFFRRFFSSWLSVALSGMLAFSFFAIEYGRFAWNPNSTPFFTILFSYTLLKIYEETDNKKNKFAWFALAGISLGIVTQLHFSAFLGLPIILFLFAAWQWQRTREILSWKNCAMFFGAILVLYIPYIVNEILTHGYNANQFLDVVQSKGAGHGFGQDIIQNIRMFSKYFLHIALGIVDGSARQKIASGIFFVSMFGVNVWLLNKERNPNKKMFLQITILFAIVYFTIYTPLAFRIDRSRFYLPVLVLPFIFSGYLIVFLQKKRFYSLARLGGMVLVVAIILSNIRATLAWFSDLGNAQKTSEISANAQPSNDENFGLTWGHFRMAADYMDENCDKKTIFFFVSKKVRNYDHSIEYALSQRNMQLRIESSRESYDKVEDDNLEGCYFYVAQAGDDLPDFVAQENHDPAFIIGNMQIIHWYPAAATNPPVVNADEANAKPLSLRQLIARHERISWGDLLR